MDVSLNSFSWGENSLFTNRGFVVGYILLNRANITRFFSVWHTLSCYNGPIVFICSCNYRCWFWNHDLYHSFRTRVFECILRSDWCQKCFLRIITSLEPNDGLERGKILPVIDNSLSDTMTLHEKKHVHKKSWHFLLPLVEDVIQNTKQGVTPYPHLQPRKSLIIAFENL